MPKLLRNRTYNQLRGERLKYKSLYEAGLEVLDVVLEACSEIEEITRQEMKRNIQEQFGDEINKLHDIGLIRIE